MLCLKGKYPELTKQTVSDFAKAYRELQNKDGSEVLFLEKKKVERPTLLPEDLMKKTIDTVNALQLMGAPVSAAVVNAVAKGIVMGNDHTILAF